jgi:hypothetical protein
MYATQQQPTGPNLFKPSLLAWRANYLASKVAADGGQPAAPAESQRRRPKVIHGRRLAVQR